MRWRFFIAEALRSIRSNMATTIAAVVTVRAKQIPEIASCPKSIAPCVSYGKEITQRVLRVTKIILVFVGSLMALLGVAAVVLIGNTIRLSIFARRREIEVMKLVGAT